MSVNTVTQLGHLSRDPELRFTKSGTPVLNGSIATNRDVPDGNNGFKSEVTFVEFTMWGKRAEAFARFHKKGALAFLTGRLTLDEWDDGTTGKRRTKLKMTAEEWEFVGGKPTDDTPF